jgi:hypothetical protein
MAVVPTRVRYRDALDVGEFRALIAHLHAPGLDRLVLDAAPGALRSRALAVSTAGLMANLRSRREQLAQLHPRSEGKSGP